MRAALTRAATVISDLHSETALGAAGNLHADLPQAGNAQPLAGHRRAGLARCHPSSGFRRFIGGRDVPRHGQQQGQSVIGDRTRIGAWPMGDNDPARACCRDVNILMRHADGADDPQLRQRVHPGGGARLAIRV